MNPSEGDRATGCGLKRLLRRAGGLTAILAGPVAPHPTAPPPRAPAHCVAVSPPALLGWATLILGATAPFRPQPRAAVEANHRRQRLGRAARAGSARGPRRTRPP